MTCDWVRAYLDRYDPATDLSDAVVEHIDTCEACRAALDERFPPALAPLPSRSIAEAPDPRGWGGAAAVVVAAAAVLVVQIQPRPPTLDERIAMMDGMQVCEVIWEPPECDPP